MTVTRDAPSKTSRRAAAAGGSAATGVRRAGGTKGPRRGRTGGKAPFIALVMAILVGTVVLLLLLTSTLATRSFEFFELKVAHDELQKQEQELTEEISNSESLPELERAAKDQGLVPAGSPGFVHLSDGRVSGDPSRATAPPPVPAWGDTAEDAEEDAESDGAVEDADGGDE